MRIAKRSFLFSLGAAMATSASGIAKPSIFDFYEYTRRIQEGSQTPHERAWIPGTIKEIDMRTRHIAIEHLPTPETEMPRMIMTFAVTDGVHLPMLRIGDRVEIQIDKLNGLVTVIDLRMRH